MTTFKLRGKCPNCKKTKWFLRNRKVKLPIGPTATSKDVMCNSCYSALDKAFNQPNTNL